jgi:T-complex protein 1 subunit zeta
MLQESQRLPHGKAEPYRRAVLRSPSSAEPRRKERKKKARDDTMAAAVKQVNAHAETMGSQAALFMNINAAKGLLEVMKTNLGPRGTIKMLVGGAGDIKLTKDGNVLLREMQIQNPTAVMIARTAVAQDDITGDGTTTTVLMIGELLKQAEKYLNEGLHPRVVVEGFEIAKKAALAYIDTVKKPVDGADREQLRCVAYTALRTKLQEGIANQLTDNVTDAVLTIKTPGQPLDLHMVEIMHMRHKMATDTRLVNGLVLDHGARHPDMKKYNENCFILTCNISLEYEKSEVNSGFFYSSADQREKMVAAERMYTDERVHKIIELKNKVCGDDPTKSFVIINQKGIDPLSLDLLVQNGIVGLRRAKKRNMERLILACGGVAVNSVEELTPEGLGYADKVYEHVIGEEKYTFVEGVKNPHSCTLLIKGPHDHTIAQIKEAIRDGLRAIKNTLEDECVIPGAGAFEVGLHTHLMNDVVKTVEGRARLGVQAFAEALLIVPKTLAVNSGNDPQEALISLQNEHEKGNFLGFDVESGEPTDPCMGGIYDNLIVKRQILQSSPIIASQLLLVDEVIRAGRNMRPRG